MNYSIAQRTTTAANGIKTHSYHLMQERIPSLDDALDAICAIGPGFYQINSSDGLVNLALRISRDGVKTVIIKRGLNEVRQDAGHPPEARRPICPPSPQLHNRLKPSQN